MKNWLQLREQVLARCEGYCEKCGSGLPESFALHHRKLKSRGGKDSVENLIALHHACHNMGKKAIHFYPEEAERTGHIVAGHADPLECPLTLANGSIVILTPEGNYHYLERKEDYGW